MVKKIPKLKPKNVPGRIKTLKVLPYKDVMVYLQQIDEEIFQYLIPYKNQNKNQIYSSYIIITPAVGKKKLTKSEVNQAAAIILTSAVATIDMLLGGNNVDKKSKKIIKALEDSREQVEALPN